MSKTKIQELADFGQSLWLDYIDKKMIVSGKLKGMVEGGLKGMTSNPTIFEQAITRSGDYDEDIKFLKDEGKNIFQIYDELTIADVKKAADEFLPVYEETNGLDGYVSLEINPQLADNTEESIKEGKRLFNKVGRANLMIKVPATDEGFLVVEELIANKINVNVTLIFSQEQYINAVKAYLNGLNRLAAKKGNLGGVRSVASVFVSRIDTAVDKLLNDKIAMDGSDETDAVKSLLGKAAVANSRLILRKFKELFGSQEFETLSKKGANIQRVLWASTGTKNPEYSDIKYVQELMTSPTVNTVPEKTLDAFIKHGEIKEGCNCGCGGKNSTAIMAALNEIDVDVNNICSDLLKAGVESFSKSFKLLLTSIEGKVNQLEQ